MIYWASLSIAIFFEVIGTLSLKYSALHNNQLAAGLTMGCYILSFSLMWYAIKKIDISIAYAIWAGMGTVLVTLIGVKMFDESLTPLKVVFVGLIVVGVIGLKYLNQT